MSHISYKLAMDSVTINGYNPMIHGWLDWACQSHADLAAELPAIRFKICDGFNAPLSREALEELTKSEVSETLAEYGWSDVKALDEIEPEKRPFCDFYRHCPDILLGDARGWELKEADISFNEIELLFTHPECRSRAILHFTDKIPLHLQFDIEREDGAEPSHFQVYFHSQRIYLSTPEYYPETHVIHYEGQRYKVFAFKSETKLVTREHTAYVREYF